MFFKVRGVVPLCLFMMEKGGREYIVEYKTCPLCFHVMSPHYVESPWSLLQALSSQCVPSANIMWGRDIGIYNVLFLRIKTSMGKVTYAMQMHTIRKKEKKKNAN